MASENAACRQGPVASLVGPPHQRFEVIVNLLDLPGRHVVTIDVVDHGR